MQHNASISKTASEKAHLLSVVLFAQGKGPVTDISRQRDLILYRIARGNGRPVPLPEIQQGEFGRFVSDPQARICDLRRLGYKITCETHSVSGQRQSTYLLELNPDGTPAMRQSFVTETPQQPKVDKGSAWRNFSYGKPPVSDPQESLFTATRMQWETGVRR